MCVCIDGMMEGENERKKRGEEDFLCLSEVVIEQPILLTVCFNLCVFVVKTSIMAALSEPSTPQ